MPRRQNTNRKNMSKGKPTVKASKAASPSPCSVWSLFSFGGRSRHEDACLCSHTHTATAWAPVHSPSTGQCPCSQHKHAAFLGSLAECNLREGAPAQQGGHEPSRDTARAEKGNRTQERFRTLGETRYLQWRNP